MHHKRSSCKIKTLRLCSGTKTRVRLIGRNRLGENSQPGFIELNSTFDYIQAQELIDPRGKTTLMLACIERYILSIGWGSYMHMLIEKVKTLGMQTPYDTRSMMQDR